MAHKFKVWRQRDNNKNNFHFERENPELVIAESFDLPPF